MVKQKHFRLPEDVLAMINNRDKEMYPTENVYITEAVRNFFKKEETENVMDELEDIQDKLDRIEKKLEEDASKKNISFSSDAEKKELQSCLEQNEDLDHYTNIQLTKLAAPNGKSDLSVYVYVPENLEKFKKDVDKHRKMQYNNR